MPSDKNASESVPKDKAYLAKDNGIKPLNELYGSNDQPYDLDDDVPRARGMPNRGAANGDNKFHERDIEKVEIRRKHMDEVQNQVAQAQGVH